LVMSTDKQTWLKCVANRKCLFLIHILTIFIKETFMTDIKCRNMSSSSACNGILVDPGWLCLCFEDLQTVFQASVTYLHLVKQCMTSYRRDWLGSQTNEC
jgi:hypothetical protein